MSASVEEQSLSVSQKAKFLVHKSIERIYAVNFVDFLRGVIFIGSFVYAWVGLNPFYDLANPDFSGGKELPNYVVYGLLACICLGLIGQYHLLALKSLGKGVNLWLCLWLLVSMIFSVDVAGSSRRLVLFFLQSLVVYCWPLLVSGRKQLAHWLTCSVLIVLLACYFGVAFWPQVSIHQNTDLLEPTLAGNWRGIFLQKNTAAFAMVIFFFISIYTIKSGIYIIGTLNLISSIVFLFFSGGKTATAALFLVLIVSYLMVSVQSSTKKAAICFGPLLIMLVGSLGTAFNDSIASIIGLLPIDATFTSRVDIWRYCYDAFLRRPITGYGFSAFWGIVNRGIVPLDRAMEWISEQVEAHNSYLEVAITIGLPGLILTIFAILVMPFRDCCRALQQTKDKSLVILFIQLWLVGLYETPMEAIFFGREAGWLMMVFAIAGLHYLARFASRD